MSTTNSSSQVRSLVEQALKHLADCIASDVLFRYLSAREATQTYPHVFQKYDLFFGVVIGAVFESLVLSLHKLLEDGGKHATAPPVNIRRILRLAEQDGFLDKAMYRSLKARIDAVVPIWKKVDHLRNNLVAHSRENLSVEAELSEAGLTSSQWRKLIQTYAIILNKLAFSLEIAMLDVRAREKNFAQNVTMLLDALDEIEQGRNYMKRGISD